MTLAERYAAVHARLMAQYTANHDPEVGCRLLGAAIVARTREQHLRGNPYTKAWGNPSLAREAAEIARRDLGKEVTRIFSGDMHEAVNHDGPSYLPELKELYRLVYSLCRSDRKEMLETPPGVGAY